MLVQVDVRGLDSVGHHRRAHVGTWARSRALLTSTEVSLTIKWLSSHDGLLLIERTVNERVRHTVVIAHRRAGLPQVMEGVDA